MVSAKYNLWGGFETGESLAQKLNNALKDPYSVEGYILVAVHAWSNSVDSLLYVNSLLDEGVRVVAPDEFIFLISEVIWGSEDQDQINIEGYPNPGYYEIHLKVEGCFSDDFNVYLEDMNGKSIYQRIETTETLNGWLFDLKTEGLNSVAYLIHLVTPDENKTVKVFKYD